MTRVAILTPDPADQSYHGLWQTVLARLQDALSMQGIAATATPWTAHVDDADGLRDHARVLPLLAWGYHRDHARWLRACETWREAGVPMSNPADVLAWNTDKRYLLELSERGVPVPHTVLTRQLTPRQLDEVFAGTGADELIVKPCVSGGAWNTRRVRRGASFEGALPDEPPADGGSMDLLIQPYLPTIASEGETSLLFFGGTLSHVVNKRPVAGDFRVQETFGGQYTLLTEPPAGALELARCTLAAIDASLLYARIDMVPDADGRWLLMEAELIEPDFYLGVDPARGEGFARALRALT
jgi:glutathione synthase/RimK-type ligase-like ATP-grasp enzyme